MSESYPLYFSLPRTVNETYGSWTIRDAQLRRLEAARRHLRDAYAGCEAQLGPTSNADYGGFMRLAPGYCRSRAYGGIPSVPAWVSPRYPPNKQTTPDESYKAGGYYTPRNCNHGVIHLPPISYRKTPSPEPEKHESEYNSEQNTERYVGENDEQNQFPLPPSEEPRFCNTPLTTSPLKPVRRRYPLKPLPPVCQIHRPIMGVHKWTDGGGKGIWGQRHQNQRMPRNASTEAPPLFPPNFYAARALSAEKRLQTQREVQDNYDIFHAGAHQIPFSDLAAIELHLKDKSKLMLSVDELKKRYIS